MAPSHERVPPPVTPLTAGYWAAAQERCLAIQRCPSCQRFVHLPEPCCPTCGAMGLRYETVSGRGSVHTFAVVHRTFAPGFEDRSPYVVAWVDLPEQPGLRAFGNVLGADPSEVRIGQPVEVCFEELAGFGLVPNFRAA